MVGWKVAPGPPEITVFDLGGIVFSLYPNEALAKAMNTAADDSGHFSSQGFALAHNAPSKEEVVLILPG